MVFVIYSNQKKPSTSHRASTLAPSVTPPHLHVACTTTTSKEPPDYVYYEYHPDDLTSDDARATAAKVKL